MNRFAVLALDLEGTLISNAMSQIPRPGLFAFLERCRALFPRIVMFTTVEEERFRKIATLLVAEGAAPAWFAGIETSPGQARPKTWPASPVQTLRETLLVDDFEVYVHPGQESQWVQVDYFHHPYDEQDTGLAKVLVALQLRLGQSDAI